MYRLNRLNYNILAKCRGYSSASTRKQNLLLEQLTSRTLLRIAGKDCDVFLQGLITNDIKHLSRSSAMYSMFLNKQGRVLYDSIIYKSNKENTFFVECDKTISNELIKHLKLFRVRRKIDIDSIGDEMKVWSAYHPELEFKYEQIDLSKLGMLCYIDPRVKSIGLRILTESDNSNNLSFITNQLGNIQFVDGDNYQEIRYKFGITEGVGELPPGKGFPLESNCDYLHGVSFHKGCYIGQELTARTHHTGVVRKRIMPITLATPLKFYDKMSLVDSENKSLGVLRGIQNKFGIGLLRVDKVLDAPSLLVDGVVCKTERPKWWPREESILEKVSN